MYYVFNYISCFFTLVSIGAVYEKNTPSWVILLFLVVAGCFQVFASAFLEEKHDDLKERIKKLENKEDNDDGKIN